MKRKFAGLLIVSSLLWSCKEENEKSPTSFELVFDTEFKGAPFSTETVYMDDYGNRLRVDNFMSYISMITLVKDDGTEILVNDFSLINFIADRSFKIDVEPGVYKGVKFGLGIPLEYNKHIDPTIYPNDHPLSVAGSQGMFWHWNTGYIFTKFEGKADTTGTEGAELLHSFSFHIGDDPFFVEHESLDLNFTVIEGETRTLRAVIHVDQILAGENDDIDLATDFITHTSGNTELAAKFVANFDQSITIE